MSKPLTTLPISEIVKSPRALKAITEAGYTTLADLEDISAETIASIPGVGPATLAELEAAWAPKAPEETVDLDSVEEGDHPILLSSPYGGYSVRLHEASEQRDGRRIRVKLPEFLLFENGEAKLTKAKYALVLYPHDSTAQREFIKSSRPWRREAYEWLQDRMGYKAKRFIILDS